MDLRVYLILIGRRRLNRCVEITGKYLVAVALLAIPSPMRRASSTYWAMSAWRRTGPHATILVETASSIIME